MNTNLAAELARHVREVHFGGNWTVSSLKDNLANVTWQQAITQVHSFNTIATLVFHIDFFIAAVIKCWKVGRSTPTINSVLTIRR